MKYNKSIIVGITFLLLLTTGGVIVTWVYNQYHDQWNDNADFENYANEFKTISEFLLEKYPDATDKWLGVSIEDVDGRGIYDSDINDLIECPTEVKTALNTICDFGFPRDTAIFEAIRVCDGNVYFCISSGKYALLYTEDDEPIWYDDSVEVKDIYIDKIKSHWYHICVIDA